MQFSTVAFLGLLCVSMAMAAYPRSYFRTGHKLHLGGASYGYRPLRYHGHGLAYAKPAVHYAAPVVYAKSYAKPHVTHYVKPAIHHPAPIVYSKPSYYLGGHGHGIGYKPVVYGGHGYVHRPVVYAKSYHH